MSRRTTPRRSGMTLIEVLIAVTILSTALLGMGTFVTKFARSTSDGTTASVAADLVVDRLEQVKAYTSYAGLEGRYSGTESSIAGYPQYVRVTTVARTNTAGADYKTITVKVTHPSLRQSVQKSTVIAAF